jgi:hypothetical protein
MLRKRLKSEKHLSYCLQEVPLLQNFVGGRGGRVAPPAGEIEEGGRKQEKLQARQEGKGRMWGRRERAGGGGRRGGYGGGSRPAPGGGGGGDGRTSGGAAGSKGVSKRGCRRSRKGEGGGGSRQEEGSRRGRGPHRRGRGRLPRSRSEIAASIRTAGSTRDAHALANAPSWGAPGGRPDHAVRCRGHGVCSSPWSPRHPPFSEPHAVPRRLNNSTMINQRSCLVTSLSIAALCLCD